MMVELTKLEVKTLEKLCNGFRHDYDHANPRVLGIERKLRRALESHAAVLADFDEVTR